MMTMIAMIFRNLYLIFRRSESGTPFDSDSIRMMGEIGIFSILIPVIGLLFSVILRILHFFTSGTAVIDGVHGRYHSWHHRLLHCRLLCFEAISLKKM